MRPHLSGRNRVVERWRRAGLFKRSLIAMEPFAKDLRRLWRIYTPMPSSAKAAASALIICIIVVPLLFVPFTVAATTVALNQRAALMARNIAQFKPDEVMQVRLVHAFAYVTAWSSTLFSSLDFVRVLHEAGGTNEMDASIDGNEDYED